MAASSKWPGTFTLNEANAGSTPTAATKAKKPIIYKDAVHKVTARDRALWKQKDGTDILIKDMTNAHLANSIKMMARLHSDFLTRKPYKDLVREANHRNMDVIVYKKFLNIQKPTSQECIRIIIAPESKADSSPPKPVWEFMREE